MHAEPASGGTARTLILVGLILDIIAEVILLGVGIALLIVPIFGALLLLFALIGFVWIALVWVYSYSRAREGDYEGARTPTLVFAILSMITLALIPGILFLIAYVKLGDAQREQAQAPTAAAWGAPPPLPPLAGGPPAARSGVCSRCGRTNPPGGAFCQGCGAPLG